MLTLQAFYEGDDTSYEWFTGQQEKDRLSKKSFLEASAFVRETADLYSLTLLEINLLLGDLGKTPEARKRASPHSITEGDHDIFLSHCLGKCPDIFPTYKILTGLFQKIIRSNAGLLHFGHLLHVEGMATAMLAQLKRSEISRTPKGFDFELVCHLCDIASVLGHVNHRGSLVMTEPLYQSIKEATEVIHNLSAKEENQALLSYTEKRCLRTGLTDVPFPTRDVLARIAAMMRITDINDGRLLYNAWATLPTVKQELFLESFTPFRKDQNIPTPTYVPAVLTNLRTSLSKTEPNPQEVMNVVIGVALPWIINVIQIYERDQKEELRKYPKNLTLNFNMIGGAVRDNPFGLHENPPFAINPKTGDITFS